ncbi:MAG: hypothetical protein Q7T82_00315 [Armatimonadota bacterium]|nr:hypothetical protein [Armatimonadota bacterium]
MRRLRRMGRRGVAASQEVEEVKTSRRDGDDRSAGIIVYTQFGRYYLQANPDPMQAPAFIFGAM